MAKINSKKMEIGWISARPMPPQEITALGRLGKVYEFFTLTVGIGTKNEK